MRGKKIAAGILSALIVLIAASCSSGTNFEGKVKVVFEPEGGTYMNCTLPLVYYYDFDINSENLIREPKSLTKTEITRSGYTLSGWYRTKTDTGTGVNYTDKWNFETDRVGKNGITLYAGWKKDVAYTYTVCYYEDDKKTVLGEYDVNEGEKFDDYIGYANKRAGYTAIGFTDKDGREWKEDFVHPGGESDVDVEVRVSYIKGSYAVVRTASELKSAKSKNIYLAADIDMKGATLSFGDYKKEFLGNGHTVSDFSVYYDPSKSGLRPDRSETEKSSLYISLFGDASGATIRDVSFTGVKISIKTKLSTTYKIYVAPLFISLTDSQISGVKFKGTYEIVAIPDGFSETALIVVLDRCYFEKDASSAITEVETEFVVK